MGVPPWRRWGCPQGGAQAHGTNWKLAGVGLDSFGIIISRAQATPAFPATVFNRTPHLARRRKRSCPALALAPARTGCPGGEPRCGAAAPLDRSPWLGAS